MATVDRSEICPNCGNHIIIDQNNFCNMGVDFPVIKSIKYRPGYIDGYVEAYHCLKCGCRWGLDLEY